MCCQIVYRKYVAPSSGHFQQEFWRLFVGGYGAAYQRNHDNTQSKATYVPFGFWSYWIKLYLYWGEKQHMVDHIWNQKQDLYINLYKYTVFNLFILFFWYKKYLYQPLNKWLNPFFCWGLAMSLTKQKKKHTHLSFTWIYVKTENNHWLDEQVIVLPSFNTCLS